MKIQLAFCALFVVAAQVIANPATKAFHFNGAYVEACSCNGPCPCELTGVSMGCQGVGVFRADNAAFDGMDFSGAKIAYATKPGSWVMIYIDAPESKRAAAIAFTKAAMAGFGPITSVTNATISMEGSAGTYTAKVNDGAIMSFTTEPTLGLDNKTALSYSNVKDPVHPIIMQGKATTTMFSDGDQKFTLSGTNAYFNDHIHSHGSL